MSAIPGWLQRSACLLGDDALSRLSSASVAIFGLGGVGGAAVEALARMGVGTFHLVDPDCFATTNLNRQILSQLENIGEKKVDVAKRRILSINPDAKVFGYPVFYLPETREAIDLSHVDFLIDAIDTVSAKCDLYRRAKEEGIPMVSCLGMGNRMDPTKIVLGDIFDTKDDPLAKVLRKKCREMGMKKLRVVYSLEKPMKKKFALESSPSTRRDTPASCALVPPVAGYYLAYEAVNVLLKR